MVVLAYVVSSVHLVSTTLFPRQEGVVAAFSFFGGLILLLIRNPSACAGNVTTFGFRGIPKFSGLVASDEDEESHAEAAMFFFDGQTMEDVKEVYVTEKSNGENAKLSVRVLDGVDYLLV